MAAGDVVRRRSSTKAFAPTPVPDETLAELLRLMQVLCCEFLAAARPVDRR